MQGITRFMGVLLLMLLCGASLLRGAAAVTINCGAGNFTPTGTPPPCSLPSLGPSQQLKTIN
jgi:hypothetical protein